MSRFSLSPQFELGGGSGDSFTPSALLQQWVFPFNVTATGSIDPVITAENLVDADCVWTKPDGGTFTGLAPANALFTATGAYTLTVNRGGGVTSFDFNSDAVSGSLAALIFPRNLASFVAYTTGFSGSVSGWVFPNAISGVYFNSTSLSGDISGLSFRSSIAEFRIAATSISYASSGGMFSANVKNGIVIQFYSCLLSSQNVDNVLIDLDTSGATGGSILIHGSNAAPSAAGLTARTNLLGKGWTAVTVTA